MTKTINSIISTVKPVIIGVNSSNNKIIERTRNLPLKKILLFNKHLNLINNSNLILFLKPGNFNSFEWKNLRNSLFDLNNNNSISTSNSIITTIEEKEKEKLKNQLKLINLRPGLLPSLLRSNLLNSNLDKTELNLNSHLKGPLTILISTNKNYELNPNQLFKILKLLNSFSLLPPVNSTPPIDSKSKLPLIKIERLKLLSSLINLNSFNSKKTVEISNLPNLNILRSQILNLLSSPSNKLINSLNNPSNKILLNLNGFKEGLKPKPIQD